MGARMSGQRKALRELSREFPGARFKHTGGSHIAIEFPSGVRVFVTVNSRSWRLARNIRSTVRRVEREQREAR
jgi:hypothetical protein